MTAAPSIAGVTEGGLIQAPEHNLDVLLGCAATGDEGAFMRVRDLTAAGVYGLALRLLETPADAEDVAVAAHQEIWSRSTCFDSTRHSAAAWIVATAHHQNVIPLRARARQEQRHVSNATQVRHVPGRPVLSMVRGALYYRPHERAGFRLTVGPTRHREC